MAADTPTLNRAANQIKTVGAARLSLDDVRALVREVGPRDNPNYGVLAIRISRKMGYPIYFYGCTDSGPGADARHEFLFGPDPKGHIEVPRAWLKVPKKVRLLKAFIGEGIVRVNHSPGMFGIVDFKNWRRPDSGDGTPA